MKTVILAFIAALAASTALAGDLPDPKLTPGATNPVLTKDLLCSPGFSTKPYRKVSRATHLRVFARYGIKCGKKCGTFFEADHLVPLEAGGGNQIENLWPQPYKTTPTTPNVKCGAHVKDGLEDKLHELVCAGTVSLEEAQHAISTDWEAAFLKYIGEPCDHFIGFRANGKNGLQKKQ